MTELITTDGSETPIPDPTLAEATPPMEAAAPAAPVGSVTPLLTAWLPLAFEILLVGLVVVGILFRFSWVNWNQNTDLHPDEYGLTGTLSRLSIPKTLGDYFNTRLSSVSPYQKYDLDGLPAEPGPDNRMRWGQWPIILIRLAAELTNNTGYIEMRLMGRQLSALCDVLTLFVIYLIGSRLYSHRAGLLAAALSALAPMQIQQSHFMTADNFAGLFVALAMYCAVRVITPTRPHPHTNYGSMGVWVWYALFGVFCGMAVASRINLAPLAGLIVVAAGIANYESIFREKDNTQFVQNTGRVIGQLALAGAIAGITFRVTQPMSFRADTGDTTIFTLNPNPEWVVSMQVAQAESSGQGGGPPGEQWTNRPALIFPFTNLVIWGMGLPLGLTAWAGLAWAAWRVLQKRDWQIHLLPLVWAGGYFLFMGTRWVKSMRYFLPIYPFLALFAAWFILELWKRGKERQEDIRQMKETSLYSRISPVSLIVAATVLLGSLAWAWGFTSIYRTENTRIQATRWIYQNVPAPINLRLQTDTGPYSEPIGFPFGAQISSGENFPVAFAPRITGTVDQIAIGHARNMVGIQQPIKLQFTLSDDPTGLRPLARAEMVVHPSASDFRGGTGVASLTYPVLLEKDHTYYLLITAAEGGPATLTGSTVANENWDEGLPVRIDGRDGFGGLYRGQEMQVRWGDDENKRVMYRTVLEETDYIILPSQRGLWSTSRLPATYPMTMEYYRALFDGRLGFDLVATFTSPIQIGPLQVSDVGGSVAWNEAPKLPVFNDNPLAAEEAFSVYDHAPVWIFKKRSNFDIDKAMAVLEAIDLDQVVIQGPREATAAPTLLMLPEDRLAEQRAGGTWAGMFNPASWQNKFQALGVGVWWLTALLLGWAAFPITFVAFHGLPERGYALARNVALLLIAWAAWFLGSFRILPFTQPTLWLLAGALVLVSGLILWRRHVEIVAWMKANVRYVIAVELFALILFIFFLLIRLGNGDLWHASYGGEKPMDFSYFNAVLKSTSFPPYDPWFAGGYLNYYYFGFVIVAVLTKMLGIVPAFAYNLILPMLFSMSGVGAFCAAYNLVAGGRRLASDSRPTRHSLQRLTANPYLAGVIAACTFVVLGNLGQIKTLMKAYMRAAPDVALRWPLPFVNDWAQAAVGMWRIYIQRFPVTIGTGEWYWNATRVIPDRQTVPITEFPFFTFLYADLHAHMIVLTVTVIALAWGLSVVLSALADERRWLESVAPWIVGGLAFGAIQPSNLSDFQTYWALGCVAFAYAELRRRQEFDFEFLKQVGWRCALFIGLAAAFFWPYTHWRGEGYGSVELWKGDKTPLDAYWTIHGLFVFIIFIFLLSETRRWMQRTQWEDVKDLLGPALFAFVAFVLVVFGLVWLGYQAALIAAPLIVWTGLLMIRRDAEPERRATLGLIGLGLLLTMVVEVVVAKGDIGRMNTVFKFYLQVWTMLSVAVGAAAAWVWAQMPEWKWFNRGLSQFGLVLLITVAALYTVLATSAKVTDRISSRTPRTLDGMLYMAYAQYADQGQTIDLKWDYDAIRWMQDNVKGSPVIVEAQVGEYHWGSRYTINTGLPGVLGWNWHQRQQRVILPDRTIWSRSNDINSFYITFETDAAMKFLEKYDVTYIIVGEYEHAYYPPSSLEKFDDMVEAGTLKLAYENPGTKIYEVAGAAAGQ